MGAVILPLMAIYFALLIWAARRGWRWAKDHGWEGSKRWLGAICGFLIVYLPVFWDWIPTVVTHHYYCEKEAGFWVYKTVDQWRKENPGVMETLVFNEKRPFKYKGDEINRESVRFLNDRINLVSARNRVSGILHVKKYDYQVVDAKSNEILARYVNFEYGYPGGLALGPPPGAGITGLKFWMAVPYCKNGPELSSAFFKFEHFFEGAQK